MYKTLYTVLVSFLTISVATGLTAAEYKGPNLSGQTVSIAGPWLTGDEENFDKVNAYFEKATGAKVDYAGSDSFEQQIVIDIKAGSPPNLAAFPQPGLAANMAAIGGFQPGSRALAFRNQSDLPGSGGGNAGKHPASASGNAQNPEIRTGLAIRVLSVASASGRLPYFST
jgi:alpha-glucoside transport system substrate-binding protein